MDAAAWEWVKWAPASAVIVTFIAGARPGAGRSRAGRGGGVLRRAPLRRPAEAKGVVKPPLARSAWRGVLVALPPSLAFWGGLWWVLAAGWGQ
jgi:hypothetical protein